MPTFQGKKLVIWAVLPFFWSMTGQSTCIPLPLLKERVYGCDLNPLFDRSAQACWRHFQMRAEKQSRALSVLLKSRAEAIEQADLLSQETQFRHSTADYHTTLKSLLKLQTDGQERQSLIQSYGKNLRWPMTWPKDQPQPDPEAPETIAFLKEEACYGTSKGKIENTQRELKTALQDIRSSIQTLKKLIAMSSSSQRDLENRGPIVPLFGAKAHAPASGFEKVHSGISERKHAQGVVP